MKIIITIILIALASSTVSAATLGDYGKCMTYHYLKASTSSTQNGKTNHIKKMDKAKYAGRKDGYTPKQVEGSATKGIDALSKVVNNNNIHQIVNTLEASCKNIDY
jgi:hypothetical protein